MIQNPFLGFPAYDSFGVTPSRSFRIDRKNKRHIYIYANTASPCLLKLGDYQTLLLPPEQWVYLPFPDNFVVEQILPTYEVFYSTFCTDEIIAQLGTYVGSYFDPYKTYARTEQGFSLNVSLIAAASSWIGIQLSTPVNCPITAVIDKIVIDAQNVPSDIRLQYLTTGDANITGVVVPTNNRLDGSTHGIIPFVQTLASSNIGTPPPGTTSIRIVPGFNEIDVLHGDIRVIPKLFQGFIGLYILPSNATNLVTTNITWHEEY